MNSRSALPKPVFTAVRAIAVVLVIFAIITQVATVASSAVFHPLRFFAYFTIQSNLIGVAALVCVLLNGPKERSRGLELLRGAAASYLTVTFFVTIFLLSGVDVGLQLPWVDFVLHKVFPVVVVLDWVLDPPAHPPSHRDSFLWVLYPLAWTAVTLVRGALDGWYPYPFLDPANGGYGTVALTAAAIVVAFFAIAFVVIAIGRLRHEQAQGSRPAPA